MAKPKRRPWIRWALMALAALILYQLATGPNGLLKLADLRRERREQERRIDSLAALRVELELEKRRLLSDSAYLEMLARRELGMAKPGEKVYRLILPSGDSSARRRP
jgi:cell division protein FtsB